MQRLTRYHGDKAKWVLDAWTENWLDPGFAKWNVADVLARVTCPVLAIHGENDEYGSLAHPTLIGQGVNGPARVMMLPATGHVPHREREAEVLRIVRDFVDFVEGQRRLDHDLPKQD